MIKLYVYDFENLKHIATINEMANKMKISAKYKFWFDAAMIQKAAGNYEMAERFSKWLSRMRMITNNLVVRRFSNRSEFYSDGVMTIPVI